MYVDPVPDEEIPPWWQWPSKPRPRENRPTARPKAFVRRAVLASFKQFLNGLRAIDRGEIMEVAGKHPKFVRQVVRRWRGVSENSGGSKNIRLDERPQIGRAHV